MVYYILTNYNILPVCIAVHQTLLGVFGWCI